MIDQQKVTAAIREFTSNPEWRKIFMEAPPGAMERLSLSFYFSKNKDTFGPEEFDEYRNLRSELEASLTEEDLQYLIDNNDKENAIQHYQELLDKLQESGGQPTGQLQAQPPEGAEQPPPEGAEPPPPPEEEQQG